MNGFSYVCDICHIEINNVDNGIFKDGDFYCMECAERDKSFYVGGQREYEKNPKKMVNIELLEKYSHYTKMPYRSELEQNYIGLLRTEMLHRMKDKKSTPTE